VDEQLETEDMSKTQEARDLLARALDPTKPGAERLAALEAANDVRKSLSIGWGKLDAPSGFNMGATLEELRELAVQQAEGDAEKPLESAEQPSDAVEVTPHGAPGMGQTADGPKVDRGGIGRLVNLLLTTTDLDYASIVARVKERYPDAKTTARSVASVAADLRRDGVEVKTRRRPGKK
jgi:hypothetical protein